MRYFGPETPLKTCINVDMMRTGYNNVKKVGGIMSNPKPLLPSINVIPILVVYIVCNEFHEQFTAHVPLNSDCRHNTSILGISGTI